LLAHARLSLADFPAAGVGNRKERTMKTKKAASAKNAMASSTAYVTAEALAGAVLFTKRLKLRRGRQPDIDELQFVHDPQAVIVQRAEVDLR
jgi:hypothetical protein